MYETLRFLHSWDRWILLVLLLVVIYRSAIGWRIPKPFTAKDNKMSLFLMIATDLQLVFGLMLYLMYSPMVNWSAAGMMKNAVLRFWTMEHLTMMLVAIVLIHIGRSKAKKAATDELKHKRLFVFNFIALLLILASIPWPFLENFKGFPWFRF